MHVYHACTSRRNFKLGALPGRQRTCFCWPWCKSEVLEHGKEILHPRDHKPPAYAGRRSLFRCLEYRWKVGSKWGRRWCGQSLCEIVSFFSRLLSGGAFFAMGSRLPDEQWWKKKINALVWCWGFYFILFYSFLFSFSLFGRMKGHILSIFGYLVLQFTYHGVLLGFFFSPSPFHFFCAHCELSFAQM